MKGYWPRTSSVDWCENNYEHSHYIAEFWNSVSSLAMIIFGEVGARLNPCENPRFKLAFRLISIVGIGSLLFHATLTKEMQALDEVPMVWSAVTMIHPLIESNYGPQGIWLPVFQVLDAILCTAAVTVSRGNLQFALFTLSFGSLEVLSMYLMFKIYLRKRSDPDIKYLFERGCLMYLFAITVWLTDLKACEYVNGGPRSLLPFNPQLHSVWHVFASIGLYFLVVLTLYDTYQKEGKKCRIAYRFNNLVPVCQVESNGKSVKVI